MEIVGINDAGGVGTLETPTDESGDTTYGLTFPVASYFVVDTDNGKSLKAYLAPEEQDFNVYVSSDTAVIAVASGASGAGSISVDATVFDNEVADLTKQNTIIVAGGCVNKLAAEFLGVPYMEFPACAGDLKEGVAVLKLKQMGDKVALLAAGYTGDDTRRAGIVLNQYSKYPLSGTEVVITGTDFTNIEVKQPSSSSAE